MGALLPTIQADHLREGLTDYLATTFALTDADARAALTDFIGHPETGMFKGPYVRLRLPFAPAAGNWRLNLDWYQGFTPYGHQAKAFERLSTKYQVRPLPTMVTTGTGSGKTEAFLVPIIDHVLRARKAGVTGMKALILYPMNALANDQAERLSALLTTFPELSGITAGIYTGEQTSQRTIVSERGLITDRKIMQQSPPDILLTNYKMLDQLLLRSAESEMWRQSAESLQYIVLDEFHTYDGAQGTDVAMLLRRLGITLKSYWTKDSSVTDPDRARPLGRVTPVATSATLGSKSDPLAMISFARTVFGEEFDESSVIGETRVTADGWLTARSGTLDKRYQPIMRPDHDEAVRRIKAKVAAASQARRDTNAVTARAVLAEMYERTDALDSGRTLNDADLRVMTSKDEILDLLKGHPIVQRMLESSTDAIALETLAARVFPAADLDPTRSTKPRTEFVEYVLALLSHVRAVTGRAALNVDVHLWIRELSRVDRILRATAGYRWSDDGVAADDDDAYLPAVYCRHCGRSGWGARLAPTGNALDVTDDAIRADHAAGSSRFRAFISAPVEAQLDMKIDGLRWFHIGNREVLTQSPDPESADVLAGQVLPVLALAGPDADEKSSNDWCPACGVEDGIRFLGSAVATQLSVTLSNLFGDKDLDSGEKKALMFTDSVQDAAHRAGFVQARSHTLSLRAALRAALDHGDLDLAELTLQVISAAGNDPFRRYQLLAPDIVDRGEFVAFWKQGTTRTERLAAEKKAKRRLQFDIDLEFGLQSRVGRTLELTGSVAAEVYLGAPGRAATLGRLAVAATDNIQLELQVAFAADPQQALIDTPSGQLGLDEAASETLREDLGNAAFTDSRALARWVRGTVERVRTQGGIHHEWLRKYIERDASRYAVWGGRPRGEGMPAFPKGRPAPAFPALGSSAKKIGEGFDPITSSASWYARWASRCLNVSPTDGTYLAKALFGVLAEQRVLDTFSSESGATVYAVQPAAIQLNAPSDKSLQDRRNLLVCDVCQAQVPGTATVIDELDEAGCLLIRCPGKLQRAARDTNFYRALYDSSEMKRVVAREHTSLLTADERLKYESGFKRSTDDPQAPNVLVATPTLEMGIDIGDLSTVMLGSLPRSVSSYLQRVGRAGRLTGNSLVLAYVRGRGEHLPKLFEPLSVIQGDVRPPATFLNAEEILQRQYVASIVDSFARDPQRVQPSDARGALSSFDEGTWLAQIIEHGESNAAGLLSTFLDQFGGRLSPEADAALRAWATPAIDGEPSALTRHLRSTVHQWNRDLTELTERRRFIEEQLPEFERRVDSPAATDDDRRTLRTAIGSMKLLGGQINSITTDYWISVLERYGVLPNYTLLDDAVTLDVGISWIDPDTSDYQSDAVSYRRGSRIALTELAPGSTFYAQGLAVKIDAVDLGTGESNIHTWQICPQCGWVGISAAGADPQLVQTCPRCKNTAIVDVSQRMQVVEMTKVSAEVRRDEVSINDTRDDRARERFTVVVAADIDPQNVGRAWFVEQREFGAEYLRRLNIRWLNVGRASSQGKRRIVAGQEISTGLFRVCASCGQLDKVAGRNNRDEHRSYCKHRTAATEDNREIALARTLSTQGVLLHLPPQMEYDSFAHPSLSAAILLGLREVIGGSPEHLDIATISDALRAPERRALLIHDTVPGGTGYLAEFANPERVWNVLAKAREIVRKCPCREEDRLACHRCLLPFASMSDMDKVSRNAALTILNDILDVGAHSEPDFDEWRITEEPPPTPPSSDESFLEKDFYQAFIGRLRGMGAAVVEKPGTYGPSATITIQGQPVRKWTLSPQPALGYVKPDFLLRTQDGSIPEIVLFADGRRYHASEENNNVTKDAKQRADLRDAGYFVWSFSAADLQRFKDNDEDQPSWFDKKAADFVKSKFQVHPKPVGLQSRDPVSQLLEFILEPDIDVWRKFSRLMPYLFMTSDNRTKSSAQSLVESAVAKLDGAHPFTKPGADICWSIGGKGLAITVAVASDRESPTAVAALDDRVPELLAFDGRAWNEWLHLSNWLGITDRHRISTRTLLQDTPIDQGPAASDDQAPLSPEWQQLIDEAVSDAERLLIRSLAAIPGIPVPELGVETDDGTVLDFAWAAQHIGVVFEPENPENENLSDQGWTMCPADADRIAQTLNANGVG